MQGRPNAQFGLLESLMPSTAPAVATGQPANHFTIPARSRNKSKLRNHIGAGKKYGRQTLSWRAKWRNSCWITLQSRPAPWKMPDPG